MNKLLGLLIVFSAIACKKQTTDLSRVVMTTIVLEPCQSYQTQMPDRYGYYDVRLPIDKVTFT